MSEPRQRRRPGRPDDDFDEYFAEDDPDLDRRTNGRYDDFDEIDLRDDDRRGGGRRGWDDNADAGREGDLPNPYAVPEVEDLIEQAIEILAESRPLPMSNTVKVNRDELVHVLEQAQARLPEELRAARWLLKERDDFVAKARQEHKDLIDEGRAQVGRMVERQQVVKAAEQRARQIVDEAKEEANTLKRQVEDYCDQRLASFEQILERTVGTVRKGRERLMGTALVTTEEIIAASNGSRTRDRSAEDDLVDDEGEYRERVARRS